MPRGPVYAGVHWNQKHIPLSSTKQTFRVHRAVWCSPMKVGVFFYVFYMFAQKGVKLNRNLFNFG